MGLSSAMTTALTGLSAAETQIDVAGNNLANSQTVGFKASDVIFANQFLRTLSHGSTPTDNNGGTNPRQIGLGVQVAEITPDFTQGTLEISTSPSDLAIQGDGFFIVEGSQGEQLYTRNGIFKTNSENELVSATGNRLLGYGVDEFYTLQQTQLVPLTIPLGSAAAAQETQNVYLNGNLTPTGDVATSAEIIESDVLGDESTQRPDVSGTGLASADRPDASATTTASVPGGGSGFVAGEQYEYVFALVDPSGNETLSNQTPVVATVGGNDDTLRLTGLPSDPDFSSVNIYRRRLGDTDYRFVANAAGSYDDNTSNISGNPTLDSTSLDGIYSYLVTFSGPGVEESRPSELLGPQTLVNGRFHLTDLPQPPSGPGLPLYDTVNIYRNLSTNADQFYLVGSVSPAPGQSFVDGRSDADIADPAAPSYQEIDLDGPKINNATRLVDVVRRNGLEYENLFEEGELTYTGRKGGNILTEKTLVIDDTTTVADYIQFLEQASGIQVSSAGDADPIPPSVNEIPGESGTISAGGYITADGRLRIVSNNGTANAVDIPSSAFQLNLADGTTASPNLGFATQQEAVGQSAATDFLVYDTLGIPLNVRLTTVLESRDGQAATYRWFADSGDNDPSGEDHAIAVGTGLIVFDGEGNMIQANENQVSIGRNDIPSSSPLDLDLDFSQLSGFAAEQSEIAATRQDGSAVGSLTSYAVGEGGEITGVFSNGISRTLGQVRLAQFANPTGLSQVGENMFTIGFNSGLPVEGNPGDLGLGSIVAGALELSNTDTGENLIDLLLASTQYRANSRVISTAQQLLDELLNVRR
jgi:flagellar hook protein FlgE